MGNDWDHIKKSKGFKSNFELQIAEDLNSKGIDGEYEEHVIDYEIPAVKKKYIPDFRLPNGIYIETKGRLMPEDRKKHMYIKRQHPELDIRFVLQYPKGKIYKGSSTTYAQWCEKKGFKWADKTIPQEWIDERPSEVFFG